MNPLLVTWPPNLYTDYGYDNFKNWIKSGDFKTFLQKEMKSFLRPLQNFQ